MFFNADMFQWLVDCYNPYIMFCLQNIEKLLIFDGKRGFPKFPKKVFTQWSCIGIKKIIVYIEKSFK